MDKNTLDKTNTLKTMLDNLIDKIKKLTSGNVSHTIPSIRSVTLNLNDVIIDDIINSCNDDDNNDKELKQLLENLKRNINAIDNVLQQLTPNIANNGKKQLITWIQFYTQQLNIILNNNNNNET